MLIQVRAPGEFLVNFVLIEPAPRRRAAIRGLEENPMFDVMMVAIALGFFVLALGYVTACDRM